MVRWPEEEEGSKQVSASLNCLKWSADGRRIITGDSMGKVTLF